MTITTNVSTRQYATFGTAVVLMEGCSMKISSVLAAVLGLCALIRQGAAFDAIEPPDLAWRLVDAGSSANTVRFLAAQVRANFEKIRTLKAHCSVRQRQELSREYVASAFAGNIDSDDISPLVQEMDFSFDVILDVASGSVFRSKDTKKMRFVRVPSLDEVTIRNVTPTDRNSVVTTEHYLFFAPKDPPATYTFVEHHPDARSKRAARRVPTSRARGQQFGDLIDPRYFFGASEKLNVWEELDNYGSALEGQLGANLVSKAREVLEVYEASNADGKWFKVRTKLSVNGDPGPHYSSTVFGSRCGFNPVRRTLSRDTAGAMRSSEVVWRWRRIDDVFVPESVLETRQVGMLERTVEMTECAVNEPLEPHQFDVQALGLEEGDLILDEIDRVALIMRNGAPQRLCAFGQTYVPTAGRASRSRSSLIAATIIAVVLLWIVFRSKTPPSTANAR